MARYVHNPHSIVQLSHLNFAKKRFVDIYGQRQGKKMVPKDPNVYIQNGVPDIIRKSFFPRLSKLQQRSDMGVFSSIKRRRPRANPPHPLPCLLRISPYRTRIPPEHLLHAPHHQTHLESPRPRTRQPRPLVQLRDLRPHR